MSKTHVNYNIVVEELSKGLTDLDSKDNPFTDRYGPDALSEFRTIRYGSGRQTGLTDFAVELAKNHKGEVLFVNPKGFLEDDVIYRLGLDDLPENITQIIGYPSARDKVKYSLVIVDNAGVFFGIFRHKKFFRLLANSVTKDVVVHLMG
ncbi:hypothetical protein ID964_004478 [Salmonella enterica]|nr:hypothetical protein [Salmonella enterica]